MSMENKSKGKYWLGREDFYRINESKKEVVIYAVVDQRLREYMKKKWRYKIC